MRDRSTGCALALALALAAALIAAAAPCAGQTIAAPTPTPTTSAAATVSSHVWRMPGGAKPARIEGEDGSLSWPVYLPATSVGGLTRFQLVFQAAISVMPEASWLTLVINGRTLGRVPIASPTSPKVMEFDLPAGALSPGWNEVRISAVQRHRVDCSIDATYELWTQIDPARTGFVGPAASISGLNDLPAVQVDPTGVERIRLILPPNPLPADIERGLEFAERVAIRGQFLHPVVDLSSMPASVEVSLLGTVDHDPTAGQSIAPGLRMVIGATGVPTLVPAAGSNDFAAMFEVQPDEPSGTPEGLRALSVAVGVPIRPGQAVTLADLGLATHAFTGRLFRAGFDLILPPDAYLADYGEAKLSFDGGYAGDLLSDARLVIRVNGVVDGSLALDREGGAALQGQIIHMPLGAFRPGRNHIEIEAQLPTWADQACDTLAAIDAKDRFLILGATTVTIPTLARIARFPNLSATFVNGFRITREGLVNLYLPHMTPGAIAAAGTLLTNVAVRTGAPIGANVLTGQPPDDGGSTIVLGVASDMPASLLQKVGIDAATAAAWSETKRGDVTGAIAAPSPSGRNRTDLQRLDAWGEDTRGADGWFRRAIDLAERASMRSLRAAGLIDYPDAPYAITPDTNFIVGQGISGGTKLTLFAAPDEAALVAGARAITEAAQLAKIDGRAAALDNAGTGLDLVPARDSAFFSTASFTLGNERLIVAGWLSSHAGYYIATVLFVAVLLGASTWATLKFSRRKA